MRINLSAQQFYKKMGGNIIKWDDEVAIGQIELTIRKYKGNTIGYINLYYLIPGKQEKMTCLMFYLSILKTI